MLQLPKEIKQVYPFKSHFFNTKDGKMHFIDTENGDKVIVFLHGNPTWSFFWRDLISTLSKKGFRCIAVDHIGMGLSEKPNHYFTLADRIIHVQALLKNLNIQKFSLCVHDWGGAIGSGVAVATPEQIEKIVITNTAAFRSMNIPKRIAICKCPIIGPFLVKFFNAFAYPATFMAVQKKLPGVIKAGYLFPFKKISDRTAVANFVRDIPLSTKHCTYKTLSDIESALPCLKNKPIFIAWGGKDFCFDDTFYNQWIKIFPNAKAIYYKNAGHYLFEDEGEKIIPEIVNFFEK